MEELQNGLIEETTKSGVGIGKNIAVSTISAVGVVTLVEIGKRLFTKIKNRNVEEVEYEEVFEEDCEEESK